MPTWVIVTTGVICSIVTMWGIAVFAFVPMLFGVYGAERYSFRGKLILKLLWLFPPTWMVSLYFAWTTNSYLTVVPYVYLVFLWLIRPNKDAGKPPSSQYASKENNLRVIIQEIDDCWDEWSKLNPSENYLFFTFFAPGKDEADKLHASLRQVDKLHGDIELMPHLKHTVKLHAGITLSRIEKTTIARIAEQMTSLAWANDCELSLIDMMEIIE